MTFYGVSGREQGLFWEVSSPCPSAYSDIREILMLTIRTCPDYQLYDIYDEQAALRWQYVQQ